MQPLSSSNKNVGYKSTSPIREHLYSMPRTLSDSDSHDDLFQAGADAEAADNAKLTKLEVIFRRKLYDGLPFISAFGMTTRESAVKRAMSMEGLNSLTTEDLQESQVCCQYCSIIK